MGETIGELIIPGTYIEVRAEGLIGVGGIATGNIGVVGTASRGPLNEVVILGSSSDALAIFGAPDPFPANPAATAHLTLARTLEQLFAGGASTVYAVRVASLAAGVTMRSMTWVVSAGAVDLFTLTATTPGTWANGVVATLTAGAGGGPARLVLQFGRIREAFEATTAADLAREVNQESSLVRASAVAAGSEGTAPAVITAAVDPNRGGPDGAGSMGTLIPEIADGLALLEGEEINIVVVAGYGADAAGAAVLTHVERTEGAGHERIAILGTRNDQLAGIAQDASSTSNGRVVLVAPGLLANDAAQANAPQISLPPAYAAALVAGKLASMAPHISLTNKDVAALGLTQLYSRAQQKQLLQERIMVLFRNLGFRALRGLTTDTGPFRQISVRRIVDYAKAGVRKGSNPYIGRLNNVRVRTAMRATLDGFLAQMVQDEMLTAYTLTVDATRRQEIEGVCSVTMTLQPTFSIDFIRVTMILQ